MVCTYTGVSHGKRNMHVRHTYSHTRLQNVFISLLFVLHGLYKSKERCTSIRLYLTHSLGKVTPRGVPFQKKR